MLENVIKTNKLCKSFSNGGVLQHVLKNLDIEIYKGDFTVIMGASGSGKSTLLYALSGMDTPTLGEVNYATENIAGYSQDQLALFRRMHCGFVFQQMYLLDHLNALENVIACRMLQSKERKKAVEDSRELLLKLGIDEETQRKYPTQISGGEAQRIGIARALINEPDVLFADEPTGALNHASGNIVLEMLTEANKGGQSIVMVTHDLRSAVRGSRILYLRDGCLKGECKLGTYQKEDKERQQRIQMFLQEMGW